MQVPDPGTPASRFTSQCHILISICVYLTGSASLEKAYNRKKNVHCERDSLVVTCDSEKHERDLTVVAPGPVTEHLTAIRIKFKICIY